MVDVGQWVYSIHREKRKISFFNKEYMLDLPQVQDMGPVSLVSHQTKMVWNSDSDQIKWK